MAADEHHPSVSPEPDDQLRRGSAAAGEADGLQPDVPAHEPEDEASCLGCLWLIVVPMVVLGAAVVTLNWLGC
jgi:hypothetical protein